MNRYVSLVLCAPAVILMACSLESKPDDAFLDSPMLLRRGVDDAGLTVRKYVEMLETRSQTDGTPVKITRWERTDAGYTLYLKFSVPIELPFIWSQAEKLSLLQYAVVDSERIPAQQFFMISFRAPQHPSKMPKAQESQPTAPASPPAPTPAVNVTPVTPEAPSASQAEMEAESEGVPSEPASAAPAPAPQQTQTANQQAQFLPRASSQTASVPSLCLPDETPVFACSTGKKRASLCLTGGSQLTYRLAPLDGAPEMAYPASAATASAAFKQGAHTGSNGQLLPFVSFDKGNYRYAVYGSTSTAQGILVEQSGKRIADLRCQADPLSELGTPKLQSLSLNQDTRPLQLP